MDNLTELKQFLQPGARLDLRALAVNQILGLTGSVDGLHLLYELPDLLKSIYDLTSDVGEIIRKESVFTIINLTAQEKGAKLLMDLTNNQITDRCFDEIRRPDNKLSDPWAMILSNISRSERLVQEIAEKLTTEQLNGLINSFTTVKYNTTGCTLDYLAPFFSNITQCPFGRQLFLETNGLEYIHRLLPFIKPAYSSIRRGGITGFLKNISFDQRCHERLADNGNDILTYILLPLMGGEVYSDEEMERFPIDLQYLDAEKRRESDPDIRKMLLECLAQLCAVRKTRDLLRSNGVYEILRELHKFEMSEQGDGAVLSACESVVDILIKTEEEIGTDNLKELEIPADVIEKLKDLS